MASGKDGAFSHIMDSMKGLKLTEDEKKDTKQIKKYAGKEETSSSNKETDSRIARDLKSLNCHFNWKILEVDLTRDVDFLIATTKAKQDEEVDETDNWKNFYQRCLLAYCYTVKEEWTKAHELLDECQKNAKTNHQKRTSLGLLYTVDADRAFIYHLQGKEDEARALLESTTHYKNLDSSNQAAVHGVRAFSLMEQGTQGSKDGLKFIQKAIDLDPEYAHWHFAKGKVLARLRHLEGTHLDPSDEECEELEMAVKLGNEADHLLFFAQTLREKARYHFRKTFEGYTSSENIKSLNKRSLSYYQKALEVKPDCPKINLRCAEGFMKLPNPFKDMNRAGRCYKHALELAPSSSMINHKAGFYFEKVEKDYERAMKCYESAIEHAGGKNFYAHVNLLVLKAALDAKFDPFPFIQDMLDKFREAKVQPVTAFTLRGLFHYKLKKDISAAAKDFYDAVLESAKTFELRFSEILQNSCFTDVNLSCMLKELEQQLGSTESDMITKKLLQETVIPVIKKCQQSPAGGYRGGFRGRSHSGRGYRGQFSGGRR